MPKTRCVLCGRQVALWNRKRIRALVAEGETEAERDEIFQEEKEANGRCLATEGAPRRVRREGEIPERSGNILRRKDTAVMN